MTELQRTSKSKYYKARSASKWAEHVITVWAREETGKRGKQLTGELLAQHGMLLWCSAPWLLLVALGSQWLQVAILTAPNVK